MGCSEVGGSSGSLGSRTVSAWHEHSVEGRVAAGMRPEKNVGQIGHQDKVFFCSFSFFLRALSVK